MSLEDKKSEEEKVGANSALSKMTHAGYTCLEVRNKNLFGQVV
jgi:hypothetical protein